MKIIHRLLVYLIKMILIPYRKRNLFSLFYDLLFYRQAQFAMEAASWSSEKEEELYSLRAETKTLKQTMMTLLKGEQEKEDKNR